MRTRSLEPEWLDALPEEDLRARRSRRDLARVNGLMGNASIIAGMLHAALPAEPRIAEIGAGDGAFAVRVIRALGGTGDIVLVDRGASPSREAVQRMAQCGWHAAGARADVFEWLDATGPLDAIFANLFLHHLDDAQLGRMLKAIALRAPVFVACEPRRSRVALLGAHLLGVVGCNDVTRHDAVVSVRAGFAAGEVGALWPNAPGIRIHERPRGLFSHAFRATPA